MDEAEVVLPQKSHALTDGDGLQGFCADHLSIESSQQEIKEMIKRLQDFEQDAVRRLLTSGLPWTHTALDLWRVQWIWPCAVFTLYCGSPIVPYDYQNKLQANGLYNTRHRHSYVGGVSPSAHEAVVAYRDRWPPLNLYKSILNCH